MNAETLNLKKFYKDLPALITLALATLALIGLTILFQLMALVINQ